MKMFRLCLLVVCFVVWPVFGQEQPVEEASPYEIPLQKLKVFHASPDRARTISSEADLTGTNGALILETGTDAILRANTTLRLQTALTDRLWLWNNGHAALGGPYDQGRLSIFEYGDGGRSLLALHHAAVEANATQTDYGVLIVSQEDITTGVTNSGSIIGAQIEARNLGPGTVTNINGITLFAGNSGSGASSSTSSAVTGLYTQVQNGTGTITTGYGVRIGDTLATSDWGIFQTAASDSNYFAGNVIIGGASTTTIPANNVLYVNGEAYFNGAVTGTNIRANYQDLAEWVPATTDLEPGTVVILNRTRNNEVMASATPYDTSVAGVVSAQPGISLGIEGEGKEQIATTGRVKVRVDARKTPVQVGDLLVTSELPGTAMRSEPMEINGRKFHQPGTIIGKALEPLTEGIGEILVLLSMQ